MIKLSKNSIIFFTLISIVVIFTFQINETSIILIRKNIKTNPEINKYLKFNKDTLIFTGYFGCSTICPPIFIKIKMIREFYPREMLDIIFLNSDPMADLIEFQNQCKIIFQDKIDCINPDMNNNQNFFRSLELPIYFTNSGFEHSKRILFYKNSNGNFYLLQDLDMDRLYKLIHHESPILTPPSPTPQTFPSLMSLSI